MEDNSDLKDFNFDDSMNELERPYIEFLLSELRRMALFVHMRYSKEKDLISSIHMLLDKIKRMEDNGAVDPNPRDNY